MCNNELTDKQILDFIRQIADAKDEYDKVKRLIRVSTKDLQKANECNNEVFAELSQKRLTQLYETKNKLDVLFKNIYIKYHKGELNEN